MALEDVARRVGAAQLVYGSDRPVAEPIRSGRDAQLQENGGRLLAAAGVPV